MQTGQCSRAAAFLAPAVGQLDAFPRRAAVSALRFPRRRHGVVFIVHASRPTPVPPGSIVSLAPIVTHRLHLLAARRNMRTSTHSCRNLRGRTTRTGTTTLSVDEPRLHRKSTVYRHSRAARLVFFPRRAHRCGEITEGPCLIPEGLV